MTEAMKVKGTTTDRSGETVPVYVEWGPYDQDFSGVITNSPAPRDGEDTGTLWRDTENSPSEEEGNVVTKPEKVLAFNVEARRTWKEVEKRYSEELNGRWSIRRPDLFGFACGTVVDVETGEAVRFGPGDSERMLARLKEADVMVTWNEPISELGILGVPFDSKLREKHLNLVVEYEFEETYEVVEYGSEKDGVVLFSEGRTEELLDLSEFRARWTANAYRAMCHLQTGSPRPFVRRDDGTRTDLTLWNITVGCAWAPRELY